MRAVAGLLAALVLPACAMQPPPPAVPLPAATMTLAAVPFSAVPGWNEDHLSEAIPPLRRECTKLVSLPDDAALGGDGAAAQLGGTAGKWRPLCAAVAAVPKGDDAAARAVLEQELQAYAIVGDGQTEGLFTGYYEPQVDGATQRGGRYQTALLGRPRDLVQADLGAFAPDLKGRSIVGRVADGGVVPYYDRAQIEHGALAAQHLAILYLADPIDAFFLEIQGSGRVRLPTGRIIRVTYDGQNGRPYVPIGRLLIERGELSRGEVTMETIRAWLVAHADLAPALMDGNPSYVFFTLLAHSPPDQGPPGALGVPLTPGRSLAVDRHFLPLGVPVFVATSNSLDSAPWRHLLLAQDVGGAIKGPVRGDIFFGWDAKAEAVSGRMKQPGTAYLLLPRATPGV